MAYNNPAALDAMLEAAMADVRKRADVEMEAGCRIAEEWVRESMPTTDLAELAVACLKASKPRAKMCPGRM